MYSLEERLLAVKTCYEMGKMQKQPFVDWVIQMNRTFPVGLKSTKEITAFTNIGCATASIQTARS